MGEMTIRNFAMISHEGASWNLLYFMADRLYCIFQWNVLWRSFQSEMEENILELAKQIKDVVSKL